MDTRKQGAALPLTKISRNERDWISYSVQDHRFAAACGLENLSETISLFFNGLNQTDVLQSVLAT